MWTENFQVYKLNLQQAEEPELKLPTSVGSQKKEGDSRKASTSMSLTMLKLLIVWITINCRKFLKSCEYHSTLSASQEISVQVKKQQLEPDMEQSTSSNMGKEYTKAVYRHPAHSTCT